LINILIVTIVSLLYLVATTDK